jgi:uncharacterized protein
MITNFRAYNFYSIGKEISIDFTKNGTTPENGYFKIKETPSRITNVSLINGFFGSNASGKTNILRGISTLIRLMYGIPIDSNSQFIQVQPSDRDKFKIIRNFHQSFNGEPIKLGADFLFNDNLYKYDIHFSEEGNIIHEKLEVNIKLSEMKSQPVLVYSRTKDQETEVGPSYKYLKEYIGKTNITSNLFWPSMLQGFDFTTDFKDKILMWNVDNNGMDILSRVMAAARMIKDPAWVENKAQDITLKALRLLNKSLQEIEIKDIDGNLSIKSKYIDFSEPVLIQNESGGTQELFAHIYNIIRVLKNGGVVIYDEINRFYHPDIQQEIFNLFLKNTRNENHAQLIFTSHDHHIMNDLELDQINLVEKNNYESINTKLSEIKDVKSRDNIVKKYRLGIYGAIPDASDFSYGLNEII